MRTRTQILQAVLDDLDGRLAALDATEPRDTQGLVDQMEARGTLEQIIAAVEWIRICRSDSHRSDRLPEQPAWTG